MFRVHLHLPFRSSDKLVSWTQPKVEINENQNLCQKISILLQTGTHAVELTTENQVYISEAFIKLARFRVQGFVNTKKQNTPNEIISNLVLLEKIKNIGL